MPDDKIKPKKLPLILAIITIISSIGIIILLFIPSEENEVVNKVQNGTETTPSESSIRFTARDVYGAISIEILDKTIKLSNLKDYEALSNIVSTNKVIIIKKGTKVELIDMKMFQGIVKIRIFGTNEEYWTIWEAIKE